MLGKVEWMNILKVKHSDEQSWGFSNHAIWQCFWRGHALWEMSSHLRAMFTMTCSRTHQHTFSTLQECQQVMFGRVRCCLWTVDLETRNCSDWKDLVAIHKICPHAFFIGQVGKSVAGTGTGPMEATEQLRRELAAKDQQLAQCAAYAADGIRMSVRCLDMRKFHK